MTAGRSSYIPHREGWWPLAGERWKRERPVLEESEAREPSGFAAGKNLRNQVQAVPSPRIVTERIGDPARVTQAVREFKKCNMARGCLCCLKYMMFLFNLIFWLCGCGLLGVGIWLSVSQGNFATFSPSFPSLSAANLVIAIGTIVMVTGFLGCLGAIKENKCLLLSFFIVLLVILLAELILLILFFVYMDKVNENAKQDLKEGLLLYNTENNVGLKNAWNIIQAEMRCCGVTDYTDWYPVLGENIVPDRCCMENSQGCGRNTTTPLWRTGCYEKVKLWFDDNKHVLGTVGMCILIMQILGMAFSMTLFQHIHRTGKKYDA
ncbi:tetraspanin-9 isoform X2 [Peromyscus eremicus]|uniref:tetraspanin-9 isoform X2 n=1 Tax=Peromyscus eremicus TaxID=42410 RepID=UPI0027DBF530|nr:tetraspanin-9 isoform X2 [Peromyscus eremicus]